MARYGIDGADASPDWKLLGGDPAPGDPAFIREISRLFLDVADNAEQAKSVASSLSAHEYSSGGAGRAMKQISDRVDELPGWLEKVTRAYRMAGEGMRKYAPLLENAQRDADKALGMARQANGEKGAADSVFDAARTKALQVGLDESGKPGVFLNAVVPDPGLESQREQARAGLADARRRVAEAKDSMGLARQLADDARAMRDNESKTVIGSLNEAATIKIPDRGLGEKIVDWFKNHAWARWLLMGLSVVFAFLGPIGIGISIGLGALDVGLSVLEGAVTGHWDIAGIVLGLFMLAPGAILSLVGKVLKAIPGVKALLALPKVAEFTAKASATLKGITERLKAVGTAIGGVLLKPVKGIGDLAADLMRKLGSAKVIAVQGGTVTAKGLSDMLGAAMAGLKDRLGINIEKLEGEVLSHKITRWQPESAEYRAKWNEYKAADKTDPNLRDRMRTELEALGPKNVDLGRSYTSHDDWSHFQREWKHVDLNKVMTVTEPETLLTKLGFGEVSTGTAMAHGNPTTKDAPWARFANDGGKLYPFEAHGSPYLVDVPLKNGGTQTLTGKQVGALINRRPSLSAMDIPRDYASTTVGERARILLNSCNTGDVLDGVAQRVADATGRITYAPMGYSITPTHKGLTALTAVHPNGGGWLEFTPKKPLPLMKPNAPKLTLDFGAAFNVDSVLAGMRTEVSAATKGALR